RLRRAGDARPCVVSRRRGVYLGPARAEARARPLDRCAGGPPRHHADGVPVRPDRAARDRPVLPHADARPLASALGHGLPLGGAHRRRHGGAGRAGGRRRGRHAPQELRLGVHRALEHAARPRFRPHRGVHAGGRRARGEKTVAALRLQNLRKSFGGLPAISNVSLEVAPGERRLIIGPNGAGKTTLFNLVTGDLPRDAGNVVLFEEDVTRLAPHHRVHRGLARTYQIITLFPKDTLEHNIALSLLGLSKLRWNAFRSFDADLYVEARAVLARVGLEHLAKRGIAEVAYGDKRRVEIAMALAQKPRVLLLDEPLAGLSREERATVKQLIAGIPREVTVVMIEHDMDTALDMAERITVLHYGRVIVEGTRAEVVADPKTREVYLGH